MEFLAVLLGLGYLFVLPLMAFVAYSRSTRHENELAALRKEVEETQRQRDVLVMRIARIEAAAAKAASAASAPEPKAKPEHRPTSAVESVATTRATLAATVAETQSVATPSPSAPPEVAAAPPQPPIAQPATQPAAKVEAAAPPAATPPSAPTRPAPPPAEPEPAIAPEPGLLTRVITAARDWLFGGNTFARLGMVVLFLGLAFLLRYVSERVTLPLELRYLGVAATALVGLILGWRLRLHRPAYALLMQGGAVGVLYLTVFAALKLHGQPLLPSGLGFALLVAIVALSCVLAVAQDALGLALAASLGGFAAPVLVSTGGGSHVALFSYFALLNAGILGIAWFKAWRPLNLVGFFGTFLIGLAWGLRSYAPDAHYASAQGFLILFFLMFVAIGLLFARRMLLQDEAAPTGRDTGQWQAWFARQGAAAQRYIDATLLFGTPLVGFGMQAGLVHHIEYATAISALLLGGFYLLLARLTLGRQPQRLRLLAEIFVSLGVIFASLTIPLALEARWTAAAWALEGAGIYWIGQRQRRPLARAFALLLQIGALLAFLHTLGPDVENLLAGSAIGALMLGLAFLANQIVLRRHGEPGDFDAGFSPLFGALACAGLALIAPLNLAAQNTAAAWALGGAAAVLAALRRRLPAWLACGLLLQGLAGLLFLGQMRSGGEGVLTLGGSSWRGLAVACLIGGAALGSLGFALARARSEARPQVAARLAWGLLFGLGFLVLAVRFVLPWTSASAVWAVGGFAALAIALLLGLRPVFWFGLVLEVIAGLGFVAHGRWGKLPGTELLTPFAHVDFWAPLIIALAALAVAWRVWRFAQRDADEALPDLALPARPVALVALLWAALWWAMSWGLEWLRVMPSPYAAKHLILASIAVGSFALLALAKRESWADALRVASLLLVVIAWRVLADGRDGRLPLLDWGWLGYSAALVASLGLLRQAPERLPEGQQRALHLLHLWVWLAALAVFARAAFAWLGDADSAWRWLGWTLPLAAWMLYQAAPEGGQRWPCRVFPALYAGAGTAPVLVVLLFWLVAANLGSGGAAAPLPYLPLANPLELAFGFVLIAGWRWQAQLAEGWAGFARACRLALLGAGFLTYSAAVLRAAHHYLPLPWHGPTLFDSMVVQAGLSLAWSLLAIALMVGGYRRAYRPVWIAGAALFGLVVVKLFLIELAQRGGLERIVSFIGVGALLLVVGYFAPLPPARETAGEEVAK